MKLLGGGGGGGEIERKAVQNMGGTHFKLYSEKKI